MIGRVAFGILVGLAILAAFLSLAAGGNLSVALPLALLASAAAAVVAALALYDRLERRATEVELPEPPPTIPVLDGLVGGEFARQTVLNDLRRLERKFDVPIPALTPAEEARILAMPRKQYLQWVTDRVALLEART